MPFSFRHRFEGSLGLVSLLLGLLDFAIGLFSGLVAAWLTNVLRPDLQMWPLPQDYQQPILLGALLAPSLLNWFGVYRGWRGLSLWNELRQVLLGLITVVAVLALSALITKSGAHFSRTWMVCWIAVAAVALCLSRVTLRSGLRWLRSQGFDSKTVALVGGGALAQRVTQHLRSVSGSGLEPVGYFAATPEEQVNGSLPCLGQLVDIKPVLENEGLRIDQLWILLPFAAEAKVREILHELRHSTVDIRMIPDMFGYQLLNYSTDNIGGLPVLNLSYSPLSGLNRYAKELLDRMLALYILIAISPLMLLIALVVRLTSSGPVLFKQVRHGWDGRPFTVYKFRTMHGRRPPEKGYQQARRNDPRVTPIGQFLRRTSLDELPQFLNVLEGTMSIVGPRPHPIELNNMFRDQVERYMWRHKVKPGITGWAQVNGYRGETDTLDKMRKRVEYDLYYIEHWSLWFDIRIILMTLWRGFTDRNAY